MSKLFMVIRLETNEPITDGNGQPRVFTDGREAAMHAKVLTEDFGVKYQPRPLKGDDKWREREVARFESGEYIQVPWFDRDHLRQFVEERPELRDHYVHISKADLTKVAFTDSAEKGEADIQTRITVRRYLDRYMTDIMTTDDKNYFCERFSGLSVDITDMKLAKTADEIQHVYENGPDSCMSHEPEYYQSPFHPTRVYAAGDLAVAYLERDERITARALVWPEKKTFSRIYGDGGRLLSIFERLGWHDSYNKADEKFLFTGAKMTRVPHPRHKHVLVIPYVDAGGVIDCGTHLEMTKHDGELSCHVDRNNRVIGLTEPVEPEHDYRCENCEEECDDTMVVHISRHRRQDWCSNCANDCTWRCSHCDDIYADSVAHNTVQHHLSGRGPRLWCEGCTDSDAMECERTNDLYDSNYVCEVIVSDDGDTEMWGPRARAEEAHFVEWTDDAGDTRRDLVFTEIADAYLDAVRPPQQHDEHVQAQQHYALVNFISTEQECQHDAV